MGIGELDDWVRQTPESVADCRARLKNVAGEILNQARGRNLPTNLNVQVTSRFS